MWKLASFNKIGGFFKKWAKLKPDDRTKQSMFVGFLLLPQKKSQEHRKSRKSVSLDQTTLKWKSYMKQNSNVVVFLGKSSKHFCPPWVLRCTLPSSTLDMFMLITWTEEPSIKRQQRWGYSCLRRCFSWSQSGGVTVVRMRRTGSAEGHRFLTQKREVDTAGTLGDG